jgi:hypothetical protein
MNILSLVQIRIQIACARFWGAPIRAAAREGKGAAGRAIPGGRSSPEKGPAKTWGEGAAARGARCAQSSP